MQLDRFMLMQSSENELLDNYNLKFSSLDNITDNDDSQTFIVCLQGFSAFMVT